MAQSLHKKTPMHRPNKRAIASDKAKSLIITCLRKYGPFSTTALTVRLGQLTRRQVTSQCKQLELEGVITSTQNDTDRTWHYCDIGGHTPFPADDCIVITDADQEWHTYWQSPPLVRRTLPRPDWFPVPYQSGIEPEFHRMLAYETTHIQYR